MSRSPIRSMPVVATLALLALPPATLRADAVLDEGFTNLNRWSAGTLVVVDPEVDHEPYLQLANELSQAPLDQTLTGDWTLSFDARHSEYGRLQWVGLFDEAARRGYLAVWDSALREQYNAEGWVGIFKVDLDAGEVTFNSPRTRVGDAKPARSGHPALGPAFARFELSHLAASAELVLKVNGIEKVRAADRSLAEFSRIIIRGHGNGRFDNVTVRTGAGVAGDRP